MGLFYHNNRGSPALPAPSLLDLNGHAGVPVYSPQEFVFNVEGTDEFLEGLEFIDRARKLVEEKNIARFQIQRKTCQDEERCGVKIGVKLEDQPAGEIRPLDK